MTLFMEEPLSVQPPSPCDPDADLRREVVEKLISTQCCLQKWHVAVQHAAGSPALNPLRGQGRVLSLLAQHTEMRQRDMCEQLGIRPQSLGEMLFKLEKAGLIERRAAGDAGHALIVRITEQGRALACESPVVPDFSSFSNDELRCFISFLDRTMAELEHHRLMLSNKTEQQG